MLRLVCVSPTDQGICDVFPEGAPRLRVRYKRTSSTPINKPGKGVRASRVARPRRPAPARAHPSTAHYRITTAPPKTLTQSRTVPEKFTARPRESAGRKQSRTEPVWSSPVAICSKPADPCSGPVAVWSSPAAGWSSPGAVCGSPVAVCG
eukprot:303250-Prymnesium_polylepis.1